MKRLAVLVSGRGSILDSIIQREVAVSLVLADRPCLGLEIAETANIPTFLVDRQAFGSPDDWDRRGFTIAVVDLLKSHNIELVAMAGFMTVLHELIFEDYRGRVLNTHPSLLPAFTGPTAVSDALKAGTTETGATFHIATEILDDHRFILGQIKVKVLALDTTETLSERIKKQEREIFPQVLADILSGNINLDAIMAATIHR